MSNKNLHWLKFLLHFQYIFNAKNIVIQYEAELHPVCKKALGLDIIAKLH